MDTAASYNIQVTADQNFQAGGKEKVIVRYMDR